MKVIGAIGGLIALCTFGCAASTADDGASTSASNVSSSCQDLTALHASAAHFDDAQATCVIDACDEGYGNDTAFRSTAQSSADGCEVRLDAPLAFVDLGHVDGDREQLGENQVTFHGAGGGDFVIHAREGSMLHQDMGVQISLSYDEGVRYSLEVVGPGACSDPQGKSGLREGDAIVLGRRSRDWEKNVNLTWPDRLAVDDSAEVTVHVRYLGGSTPYDDGEFDLLVQGIKYRAPIDGPPEMPAFERWDRPSLVCSL